MLVVRTTTLVLVIATSALISGCPSDGQPRTGLSGPNIETTVSLDTPDGKKLTIKVQASKNSHCREAVKHLRNYKWEKAFEEAEEAIAQNGQDHRALFVAGVAKEKLNDLDKALDFYEKANFRPDVSYEEYQQAVNRVREKLRKGN